MLVISRKKGQKIMINDNIVITIVDTNNGQCKLAIDADKEVKIYREEIYYQIKLANLIGKDTNTNAVDSVSDWIKNEKVKFNDNLDSKREDSEVQIEKTEKAKRIIVKKDTPKDN